MQKIEKLPVFGYRGNSYFFDIYPLEQDYPSLPGIYIIAKRVPAPNALYTIVWVGHTDSFKNIPTELQQDCTKTNGANSIGLIKVEKEEDRLAIVKEITERFKPICNMVANS